MASNNEMKVTLLFHDIKSQTASVGFLRSDDLLSTLWRILRGLLIEINKGLKVIDKIFGALVPILLLFWVLLWILDLEDLKSLQKYLKWWIIFCLVMIGLSRGLSALITAKIK